MRKPADPNSESSVREYLLLDYGHHWDYPKGHVERGETDLQAARRELLEETGLAAVAIDPEFSRRIHYFYRDRKSKLVNKSVVFFLGKVEQTPVKLSHEHVACEFLPYEPALKRLTYASARDLLRQAETHLTEKQPDGSGASS